MRIKDTLEAYYKHIPKNKFNDDPVTLYEMGMLIYSHSLIQKCNDLFGINQHTHHCNRESGLKFYPP